jgi:hypothetical protein
MAPSSPFEPVPGITAKPFEKLRFEIHDVLRNI